jgi:hypothetical protein
MDSDVKNSRLANPAIPRYWRASSPPGRRAARTTAVDHARASPNPRPAGSPAGSGSGTVRVASNARQTGSTAARLAARGLTTP